MQKPEIFNELLQQLQLDIRLEVILADLLAGTLELDDILIINNSLFKRNYHNDIEKIEEVEYGLNKKTKLCFVVNRDGIYDALPEDLLHQPADSFNYTDKERIIKEMKVQNELEKSAKSFLLPYEQEFYWQRIKLELEERKFLFETNSNISGDLFNYLWSLPDFLDNVQKSKIGILMPVLNSIVGDWILTKFIIESLTGDEVELMYTAPICSYLNEECSLGSSRLGVDSLLGGKVMDMQSSVTIKIYLRNIQTLSDYMPDGKKMQLYQYLSAMFIPFENDIIYELEFSKNEGYLLLDTETSYLGRLNYTTII